MGKASKKWIMCVALVLTAILLLGGCSGRKKTPEVSLSTPRPVENTMYQVTRSNIIVDYTGIARVTSYGATRYAFEYSGAYVEKIHVNVGQNVKAGDTLVTLNKTDLRRKLSAAEDELRHQKTLYDEAVAASGEDSSSATSAFRKYNAALQERDALQAQLDSSTIVAESDGVVRYINTRFTRIDEPNATTVAGEVVVIVDPEDISNAHAVLELSPITLNTYHIDLESEITLYKINNYSIEQGERFTGKVIGSSQMPSEDGTTFFPGDVALISFYISLENAPDDIAVGDSLSVTYVENEARDTLIIPLSALYQFGGKEFVYILDSQGLRRECYVETGLRNEMFVQIVSGLEEGDIIIQY